MSDVEAEPAAADAAARDGPVEKPKAPLRTIAAHGVIGDQGTAALVADDGAVDFLCWPTLDGPSVFAALLDPVRGGAWEITPLLCGAVGRQSYLPDTNVLRTLFSTPDGVAEITDFMPFPEPGGTPRLVRRVRTIRGEVGYRLSCAPRLDYARATTLAETEAGGSVTFRAADGEMPALRLSASVPLRAGGEHGLGIARAEFTLAAGARADFMLSSAEAVSPEIDDCAELLRACMAHWHGWVGRMSYRGRWRETVTRSALTLKLLTSAEHGSISAAVTFGLPESPGGARNWDYRATWIRDASFTVYAFVRLGYADEANAFMRWVQARAQDSGPDGSIQIMYGLDGRKRLDEAELTSLSGYGEAGPVRIGNNAYKQVQLDIYGELLDAGYLANKYGNAVTNEGWRHVVRIVDYVCTHWRDPDQGIWEMRGPPRHWLHSRLMCWVAVDRAARLALKRSLPAPLARWHKVRDDIHASIWDEFWDAERGHFVAALGGVELDASMLMMPLVRFVSATDPQWLATLDAIGEALVEGPFVFRYRTEDGLNGTEGAFSPCSFWYAECLARAGRLGEARLVFEAMLGYANHLGLFSEEIGLSGEQMGNTPQALTHLALISAAFYLDRELSATGSEWRS